MSALVNYSGEDELLHGRLFHMDVYSHSRKRLRISAPFTAWEGQVKQEKKPSIEALPDECLFEILRRLPAQERSTCACVSKHWLSTLSSIRKDDICNSAMASVGEADDGSLSRCLEGKKATDLRLHAMAVGTANRGGLGKLSIRGSNSSRGVTDYGLSAIARGCPTLRSLSVWNISSVGDKGLIEIAKGCPLLEKLDLSHCPSITNRGLIAIAENCPNLSALSIESCSRIGNDSLQAIANQCTKLEMISIKDCRLIGDQGIASLSSSSSLTKLKLNGLSISDFSLAVIGHYGKSIVHLNLANLKNVSEKGFWVMGNARGLQSLTSLAVSSCLGMTDFSIEAIGIGCPVLKQICLRKCCFISDHGFVAFSKAVVSLESLHLEEVNRITLSGVISALSACQSKLRTLSLVSCIGLKDLALGGEFLVPTTTTTPCRSLQSLSIRNCAGFGSFGLAILGNLCPEIRQLDLSGLYGITDEGLLSLVENCEGGLVKLNLSGCFNLSDEVIMSIVRTHGETIKIMNLEGCRRLTDASLFAIAESCQLLKDLDMSFCGISDSGLSALSSAKQLNIQILACSGCALSDKSLPSLIKLGESLVGLNLKHCSSLSSKAVDLLAENMWRCDMIY